MSEATFDPMIWAFPLSFRRTPPVVMTLPPRSVLRWGLYAPKIRFGSIDGEGGREAVVM
jgi:hypothetical protein